MSEKQTKNDQPKSSTSDDAGEAQVQEMIQREQDQGYRGVVADPTPNSAYTIAGVTSGEPTPETDEGAKKAAAEQLAEVSQRTEPVKKGEAR